MSTHPTPSDSSPIEGGRHELTWLDLASCQDLDVPDFFVDAGHVITEAALDTCRGCPVRRQCVIHAYTGGPSGAITGGYYGGMSPGQRRDMPLDQALDFIAKDLPRGTRLVA
jgi:hypothetical protein